MSEVTSPRCYRASDKGHYDVIRVLAAYGADLGTINTQGNTSLHIAARKGFANICKFVAQRGTILLCYPCRIISSDFDYRHHNINQSDVCFLANQIRLNPLAKAKSSTSLLCLYVYVII